MEWENYVVKINIKSKDIDFNHPLNTFNTETSSGTGFFIANNMILTCYHVVKYAFNIEIIYKQNTIIQGKVRHLFPDDDLAIVELEKHVTDCNILKFKVLDTKQIGDVITIGFPLGSTNIKVTKGIISGFQDSFIQTDATINPGNSGGPLVIKDIDTYYLIGINVSKMIGNAEGTSYVVPIYRFMILQKLMKNNPNTIVVKKPLLLFNYQKLIQDEYKKKLFKKYPKILENNQGVIIVKINTKYYLNKYLKTGDIIVSINSKHVDNFGTIKFDFYPEKIPLKDIGLWFIEGDILDMAILDNVTQEIRNEKIILEIIKTNSPEYYGLDNYPSYFVENNGLIFSLITQEHIQIFKNININMKADISRVLINTSNQNDIITVYLADLDYNKLDKFIKYPIGEIIMEINDKKFDTWEMFLELTKEPITKMKTFDNKTYFVDNTPKVPIPQNEAPSPRLETPLGLSAEPTNVPTVTLPEQQKESSKVLLQPKVLLSLLKKLTKLKTIQDIAKKPNPVQYAINNLAF